MQRSKRFGGIGLSLILLASPLATRAHADPTTMPASQPSVASVLAEIDSAYAKLKTAQFGGQISGHFDVAGQEKNQSVAFNSSFSAPNQFRHEIPEQILLLSNGANVLTYLNTRDEYQSATAPKSPVTASDWPASITGILKDQNPSLLLAMTRSASAELNQLSSQITLASPTLIDGVAYDTLHLEIPADHQTMTLLVDPSTHLLRQVKTDLRQSLESAGATDVKSAEVTIDYSQSTTNAVIPADLFAWTAPAGSMLVSSTVALAAGDDNASDEVKALVGKDAPDFSLKALDDSTVKLSDLKGSVVVIDFWATWCGPCVKALPHLEQLYKDQSPKGLKVLAVDFQEDKAKVKDFVDKKGWTLPVVLDSDGAVGSAYKADAIPETIIVGKDGKIKQIFVGGGHEEQVSAAVEAEMSK